MAQKTSHTPRAQEMFALVEKYLASGSSRKEFCKQESIPLSTLQWWLGQYRRTNHTKAGSVRSSETFVPVKVTSPKNTSIPSYPACIVEYPNGVVLQGPGDVHPQRWTFLK